MGTASIIAFVVLAAVGAKGNDPAVIALANKVLGCPWKSTHFERHCDAFDAFLNSELIRDGKADATLVALVENPNPRLRYVAAKGLAENGDAYRFGKKLSERLLNVMDAEASAFLCSPLGSAVGYVEVQKTGLLKRVEKIITSHAIKECRAATVRSALVGNPGHEGAPSPFSASAAEPKANSWPPSTRTTRIRWSGKQLERQTV